MNGNYQFNKSYAQEKMNAHRIAAQAHRQAQEARGKSSRRSIINIAAANAVRVYHWTGRLMNQAARGVERLGKENVSARYPRSH